MPTFDKEFPLKSFYGLTTIRTVDRQGKAEQLIGYNPCYYEYDEPP